METETYSGLDSIPDPPQSMALLSFTACELGGVEVGLGKISFLQVNFGVSGLEGTSDMS